MSQGPRRINTDRSLNRPTEQRPAKAPAQQQVPLSGQPDFFQPEADAPGRSLPMRRLPAADGREQRRDPSAPPCGSGTGDPPP